MTYKIKVATEEDRRWAIHVACKYMIEKEVKRPDLFNVKQLHLLYHKLVKDGTGLIAWKGDERVGCVGGMLVDHLLNPDITMMYEAVWYVHPDYRSTRVPYLLMTSYKDLVQDRADEGVFTILGTTPIKDESLERMGWTLQEKQYTYRSK